MTLVFGDFQPTDSALNTHHSRWSNIPITTDKSHFQVTLYCTHTI